MKKKTREQLRMERYARTLAYIASEDDDATDLMIESLKKFIQKKKEAELAGNDTLIVTNDDCLIA